MPKILWPFFRDNPRLAKALPALAAAVIQGSVFAKHGLRVGIVAILHTFNGPLEFNSHGHTMVTAGGLCGVTSKWVASVYYDDLQLMKSWRRVVVRLLRTALQAGQLRSTMCAEQVEALFFEQEKCSWIIKVQTIHSKEHFLKYAGRYVRRPPIAQRRITYIGQGLVRFWAKDKKMGCVVPVECTLGEFLDRWAQHIREHYQHAVRNFGLFSPRALKHTSAAILAILGQIPKSRPKPIPWAVSLKRDFGRDPLLLPDGKRMTWVRRLAPKAAR